MTARPKHVLPVLILGGVGLGISIVTEVVHSRLATNPGYTSFCNISANVNCDVVMGSRHALLAGVSVSLWAIVYYLTLAAVTVALARATRAQLREKLALALVLLAAWGLLFSLYMAAIAFGVLHAVCALCGGLYLVNIAMFPAAWRLRAQVRLQSRRQAAAQAGRERLVLIAGVAIAVIVLAIGSWEVFGRGMRQADIATIKRLRPDFYRWYVAQPIVQVPRDGGHARGNADAPVTIVAFSDFECGHCANFHRSLDSTLRRLGPGIRVVFHHFPLDSACNQKLHARFHPQACLAAVAAECAAEQEKFWQYHDILFDNQQHLDRPSLITYATRLGLDGPRFSACLDSPASLARVQADIATGVSLGIDSTPTVFINGRLIKGTLEPDLLSDAVTLAGAPAHSQ
ncbi:MAG: Vitamin epoxide reductase [Deltaproteobacteria bacterium]|nr:Vitamin epoxide reductase [Deltaproteobacteria bacterium]